MKKITLLEGEYHGTDQGADHAPVDLVAGDSAEVSAEKAEQLERDFPAQFSVEGAKSRGRQGADEGGE